MYGFYDLIDKIRRYFKFNTEEIKALVIAIIVIGFVISFREWGYGDEFSASVGLRNLFIGIILAALVVLIHETGHRVAGLWSGFRVEHQLWWFGIGIALVLAFMTRGNVWFLGLHAITLHHMAIHRLGYFRYGTNTLSIAMTSLAGPIANILVATLLWTLEVWFGVPITANTFLNKFILVSWIYAVTNLLPIPPLDGAGILFQSRLVYYFVFGSIAGYAILLLFNIHSFIFALLIGGLVWLIYYVSFERGAWKF